MKHLFECISLSLHFLQLDVPVVGAAKPASSGNGNLPWQRSKTFGKSMF